MNIKDIVCGGIMTLSLCGCMKKQEIDKSLTDIYIKQPCDCYIVKDIRFEKAQDFGEYQVLCENKIGELTLYRIQKDYNIKCEVKK